MTERASVAEELDVGEEHETLSERFSRLSERVLAIRKDKHDLANFVQNLQGDVQDQREKWARHDEQLSVLEARVDRMDRRLSALDDSLNKLMLKAAGLAAGALVLLYVILNAIPALRGLTEALP